jgi:hypothetical protein
LFELGLNIGRALDERLIIVALSVADVDISARDTNLQNLLDETFSMIEPEATPAPIDVKTYYVNATQSVNLRSCSSTTGSIAATANRGDALQVIDDSGDWYEVQLENGEIAFIASFLVSANQPSSAPPTNVPPAVAPTNVPQPPAPTNIPPAVAPQQTNVPSQPPVNESVAEPPASFTCNCSKTCEQMASCDEAYFQLNQCGCGRRDSDNDSVPCENICPGG